MGYNKILILNVLMVLFMCGIGYSKSSDSAKIIELNEQIERLIRKLDSVERNQHDNVGALDKRIVEVSAKNDGRFDAYRLWIPIFTTLVVAIAALNWWRVKSIAQIEAQQAFEERFKFYCDKIEKADERASQLLSEIQSHHEVATSIKDKMQELSNVDSTSFEKIKTHYEKDKK